jgi:hypothetical protein
MLLSYLCFDLLFSHPYQIMVLQCSKGRQCTKVRRMVLIQKYSVQFQLDTFLLQMHSLFYNIAIAIATPFSFAVLIQVLITDKIGVKYP